VSDAADSKADLETSMEAELLDRFEAKEPSAEEKRDRREEHRHHLVRDTTSTLTVDDNPDMQGVEVTSTIEIPDLYCFTCKEWVGLSGVDLSGTPRSKADAYYLDGPPDDLQQARDETQSELLDLAYRAMRDVDRFESLEDGLEFVDGQIEQVRDEHDE